MSELPVRRFVRLFLYALFALGTVIMAGSLSPERIVRRQAVHPASAVVAQMAAELPPARQTEWKQAAEQDPVTLFRLCQQSN